MKRYLHLETWWGPESGLPFAKTYVEIGDHGWVSREVGLDGDGRVVYKFPLAGSRGGFRGICDLATFVTEGEPDDISAGEFEDFWQMPVTAEDQLGSIRAIRGPSGFGRVLRWFKWWRPR
jgi:hypothetical protein